MLTLQQKMAVARCLSKALIGLRRVVGAPHHTTAVRQGVSWELDLREGVDLALFLGVFERRTVRAIDTYVRPGMVVLDIGANIGAQTFHLARRVGEIGRVIAFEPTNFDIAKLRRNMDLNPALKRQITAAQVMLMGSSDAAIPERVHASWSLDSDAELDPKYCARAMPTGNAKVWSLDDYLEREGIGRVDIVKMDVDGYECSVLRGAKQTLIRHRPMIIMEFAPYIFAETGESVDAFLAILSEVGYAMRELESERRLPEDSEELHRRFPEGTARNVRVVPLR